MSRQLKVTALITFVLAVLFYLFFQVSKHNLALSQVNAFAEDPYDAVGSFGVQLAMFTALLTLVRAFRPYGRDSSQAEMLDNQKLLLVRGEYFSCLSVVVTLVADVVAMIRYPSLWIGSPIGQILAGLVVGLALLAALVGWLISHSMRHINLPSAYNAWIRAIVISIVSILILALYPETWRQSFPGALFTVLVGMALFIVSVWALGLAISPYLETHFEDFLDDLASVYRWLKAHIGHLVVLCTFFEKMLGLPFVCPILSWLNPRNHSWNFMILIAIVLGVVLALAETIGEGSSHQIGRLAIVVAVFISLEASGVLLGYALLAKPLGLFRQDCNDKQQEKKPLYDYSN